MRRDCGVSGQYALVYLVLVAEVSNNTIGIYSCSWEHNKYLQSSNHHLKSLECITLKTKGVNHFSCFILFFSVELFSLFCSIYHHVVFTPLGLFGGEKDE